jgi:PAS domain S-box-containing protein
MFGYEAEEVLGRMTGEFVTRPVATDPADIMALMRHSDRTGAPSVIQREFDYIRKDGSIFPGEVKAIPLLDSTGAYAGMQGVIRDISERKHLQAEQDYFKEQLAKSEQLLAVGRLAGGIAHDFNNQLTGIIGFAELVHRTSTDAAAREHAGHILSAAETSAGQIARLLSFSRPSNRIGETVDLVETVKEVLSVLGHGLERNAVFRTDALEPSRFVRADPDLIRNVVHNLCRNAVEALAGNPGVIILSTSSVSGESIPASVYGGNPVRTGRYGLLTIRDNGPGMSREVLSRLFEPFFSTKHPSGGMGLGLAMALHAVTLCKGAIAVDSVLGKGSVFSVYLPLAEELPEQPDRSSGWTRGHGRILVVDDEEVVRSMVSSFFSGLGYEVTSADSGGQALELLKSGNTGPDLIILDMVMPGASGRETFETIHKMRPGLPVILASGNRTSRDIQDLLASGAAGFFQKPFPLAELSRTVADLMKQSG